MVAHDRQYDIQRSRRIIFISLVQDVVYGLFYFFYFIIFGNDTCYFRFDQQFDNLELRMHGIDELRNIHTFLLQVGYDIQGCFILNLIIYN